MEAQRPLPTCSGPVGLALTNSTCAFCPLPRSLCAKPLALGDDRVDLLGEPGVGDAEVDEAGRQNLHLTHVGGRLHLLGDNVGDLHGAHARGAGQSQGQGGRVVAVVGVGGAFYSGVVQGDAGEVAGGLCAPCGGVDQLSDLVADAHGRGAFQSETPAEAGEIECRSGEARGQTEAGWTKRHLALSPWPSPARGRGNALEEPESQS